MQDAAVVAALERAGLFADYRDGEATRRDIESAYENLVKIIRKPGLAQ